MKFKLSVLVFIKSDKEEFLLIERAKSPNKGLWSPIGGKLETTQGESPFEAAIREVKEEINLKITEDDLHLFSMITEKAYEGTTHWLLFLFDCKKTINELPKPIDEGSFKFFTKEAIEELNIPKSDKKLLWDPYHSNRTGFTSLRANSLNSNELKITQEQAL